MAVADALRVATLDLRGTGPHPLHGVARIAFHVDQLLVTSWSFGFLACGALYFLRRRRLALSILGVWLLAWGALVATYPLVVTARLMVAYQTLFWATLAVSWATILFVMFRRRTLRPGLAHLVLIMYATSDLVVGAFPFLHGFLGGWQDARLISLVTMTLSALFHVQELLRPSVAPSMARERMG
jgi:hypothetical protein